MQHGSQCSVNRWSLHMYWDGTGVVLMAIGVALGQVGVVLQWYWGGTGVYWVTLG